MKKIINYFILGIFSLAIIGIILYIALSGKDLVFAQYIIAGTSLLSLWYTILQANKNDNEKEAKIMIEISPYAIHYPSKEVRTQLLIKNNSNFNLINVSIILSKSMFFNGKPFEDIVSGNDISAKDVASWVVDPEGIIKSFDEIKYTLHFYDERGNLKKIKGKIINRF